MTEMLNKSHFILDNYESTRLRSFTKFLVFYTVMVCADPDPVGPVRNRRT
jgi:hypothetical protein